MGPGATAKPSQPVKVVYLGATFSTTGIIRFFKIKSPTHRYNDTKYSRLQNNKYINTRYEQQQLLSTYSSLKEFILNSCIIRRSSF